MKITRFVDRELVLHVLQNTTEAEQELIFRQYDELLPDDEYANAVDITERIWYEWFGTEDITDEEAEEWDDVYLTMREAMRLKTGLFAMIKVVNQIVEKQGEYVVGQLREVFNAQAC